ncbi:Hypothetical predicted protein [Lecanosticta acicola]|uniref:Uncharacterized protein n=1 Tax=Lecanosticta acicola TaxID=111012 RepID=A0AAI8Z5S8_9PEZI|nr:Hypothetical predicted protein [Lecanosticta acicola]
MGSIPSSTSSHSTSSQSQETPPTNATTDTAIQSLTSSTSVGRKVSVAYSPETNPPRSPKNITARRISENFQPTSDFLNHGESVELPATTNPFSHFPEVEHGGFPQASNPFPRLPDIDSVGKEIVKGEAGAEVGRDGAGEEQEGHVIPARRVRAADIAAAYRRAGEEGRSQAVWVTFFARQTGVSLTQALRILDEVCEGGVVLEAPTHRR